MSKFEIEVDANTEVIVRQSKKTNSKFRFNALGVNMLDDNKDLQSVARIMKELDSNAHWLLWSLVEVRDYKSNLCVFSTAGMNAGMKQRGVRGFKELKELGLVEKVARKVYLINPDFIMPDFNNYHGVKSEWLKARAKVTK